MKRIALMIVSTLIVLSSFMAVPVLVGASAASNSIEAGAGGADPGGPSINSAISVGINLLSFMVGIASVIMIIYGGYRYVTSAGDANKAAAAKNTILYACIGVAITGLAQVILRLVVSRAQ